MISWVGIVHWAAGVANLMDLLMGGKRLLNSRAAPLESPCFVMRNTGFELPFVKVGRR